MIDKSNKIKSEEVKEVSRPTRARVEDIDPDIWDETVEAGPNPPSPSSRVSAPHPAEEEPLSANGNMPNDIEKHASPRAAAARKLDYLESFLTEKPISTQNAPGGDLYEAVVETLKNIYDPEIPVNIYDLGLIYGVEVKGGGHVLVTMTLTTPHCPVAESMPGEIELQVGSVPGVGFAEVELVWDPPWDPQKMSDEAKLELGML